MIKFTTATFGQEEIDLSESKKLPKPPQGDISFTIMVNDQLYSFTDGKFDIDGEAYRPDALQYLLGVEFEPVDPQFFQIDREVAGLDSQSLISKLSKAPTELERQIIDIDTQLQAQRRRDAVKAVVGKLEQKLESKHQLLDSVSRIVESLQSAKTQADQVKRKGLIGADNRIQLSNMIVSNVRNFLSNPVAVMRNTTRDLKHHFQSMPVWPLLLMALMIVLVAAVRAYTTGSTLVLLVGLGVFSIELIVIALFTGTRYMPEQGQIEADSEVADAFELNVATGTDSPSIQNWLQSMGLSDVQSAFVDQAYFSAYQSDIENLGEVIRERLNGETMEELQTEITSIEEQLQRGKQFQSQGTDITPDQYLRKRRELDGLRDKLKQQSDSNLVTHPLVRYLVRQGMDFDYTLQPGNTVQVILQALIQISQRDHQQELWPIFIKENLMPDASEQLQQIGHLRQVIMIE